MLPATSWNGTASLMASVVQLREHGCGMAGILFGHHQVKVACPHLLEGGNRFALDHFKAHIRIVPGHVREQARQKSQRGGLEHGQFHCSGGPC